MSSSLLSVDQIINYSIGADLMNKFMTWQIVGTKKDDGKWYTTDTMKPSYSKAEWSTLVSGSDYYSENNDVYTNGEFWGASVEMQKSEDGKTKTHNFGSLYYNVPYSDTAATISGDKDYYIIEGSSLTGLDGNDYSVKLYVPATSDNMFSTVTTSSPYIALQGGQTIGGLTPQGPGSITIAEGTEYTTTNSSTLTREMGMTADLSYKLKSSIEKNGVVESSVEQTIKAALEFDFSSSDEAYEESQSTLTVNSTTTYYNYSTNPYLLVPFTDTNQSTSTIEITGKLGSTSTSSPSDDNSVVQYYIQKNGKNKYKQTTQLSIEDALASSQEAIAMGGTSNDETLANYIDPSTGNITTTGTFDSINASSGTISYWFYDAENNCYASKGRNEDDCDCDKNDLLDIQSTCDEGDSTSRAINSRYERSQELEFSKELFTLSKLKEMHKTRPIVKDTIVGEKDGNTFDVQVGSMAETNFLAYVIGGDVHDWHTNKGKGKHGGSILHGGTDQYDGNSGRDFVSSKSFGGASRINTKAGRDVVLIDLKKVNKFTPGQTSLGRGSDTIVYKGSDKDLTITGTDHEFLTTGKGKDEIIARKNIKLHVNDFDLGKDSLKIDYDRYQVQINGHTVVFSNDEGGSIILRNVLGDFDGSIDNLPFG